MYVVVFNFQVLWKCSNRNFLLNSAPFKKLPKMIHFSHLNHALPHKTLTMYGFSRKLS